MLGSKNKVITKSEQKTKLLVRKSLVAKIDIKKGEILSKKILLPKDQAKGFHHLR